MENLAPFFAIVGFLIVFPLFWCGVVYLTSLIGGWMRLANHYRYDGNFQGQQWSFQGARIGLSSYSGVLTVGANWEGLYLKTMFLFRCGHPPLFIPWHDLSVKQTGTIFKSVEFRFQRVSSVRVKLSQRLSDQLAEVAGDAWPKTSDFPSNI